MTEQDLKELIEGAMQTLVPDEEYSVSVSEINGQLKAELNSESKRAMVAWAEISFMLEDMIERVADESLGF